MECFQKGKLGLQSLQDHLRLTQHERPRTPERPPVPREDVPLEEYSYYEEEEEESPSVMSDTNVEVTGTTYGEHKAVQKERAQSAAASKSAGQGAGSSKAAEG